MSAVRFQIRKGKGHDLSLYDGREFHPGCPRSDRSRGQDEDPFRLGLHLALFKDLNTFAVDNPDLTLLIADDPGMVGKNPREPRLGWTALNGTRQVKSWTITFTRLRASQGELPPHFAALLRTPFSRVALLRAVTGR